MLSALLFLYATLWRSVDSAHILFVAPFPSVSHYRMIEPLTLALAERGHQVTVLSHYPQSKPVPNYRDVSLRGAVPSYDLEFSPWGLVEDALDMFSVGAAQCEAVVSSSVVQNFLKEDVSYDLVFLEMLDSDCYLGFVKRYSAPYILCSSTSLMAWFGDWIRQPSESNYVPSAFCRLGGKMDLIGRLQNIFCVAFYRAAHMFYNHRWSVDVVRKHFHVDVDTLDDVRKNVSMVFLNSFYAFNPVRALFPNVVELGGIHIREAKPLPEKIEKFLNESREGAIVFSMGSMVKAHTLDPKVRECFVKVFQSFPEIGILWKWERDLEGRPGNVMVVEWLPQSDVLGHKNVKLFITHGGVHGIIEAVHHGVPVLGIPLYGDQTGNLKHLEHEGAGICLDFHTLTPEVFASAIREILGNKRYLERARHLSRIMRDRPLSPLDLGVFWTEHVLRNGPIKLASTDLEWYQYLMFDVLAASTVSCVSIFFIVHNVHRPLLANEMMTIPRSTRKSRTLDNDIRLPILSRTMERSGFK